MTTSPFIARQQRLAQALRSAGLDALLLNPGPSLVYLTGLHLHLMERPMVVVFTPTQPPLIVLPQLEAAKLIGIPYPLQSFFYTDDPATWPGAFQQALAALDGGTIGVEPTRLRFLELRLVEGAAPRARCISAESILEPLRIAKDASEIAFMRQAVQIAQEALQDALAVVRVGMTERQLAAELTVQLLRHGSTPEMPFGPIVSAGPNSANPHASPSDRPLTPGDLLVIDWGAAAGGYISDLTRTFAIGEVEAEFEQIAVIVEAANAAGRAAAAPGAAASVVDDAARGVIERAGYGAQFFHRTGHGIGMEGHESPYIRAGSAQLLLPGMSFTVEPGIYLTGRGGVRIEDNVVITESGAETLSDLPRKLIRIAG